MLLDQPARAEWRTGWRIVFGAGLCAGLGIPLFYYVFSIFSIPMSTEFGISRGELANYQALLVIGALAAPLIGKLLDRRGFAVIFTISTLVVIACHIALATVVTAPLAFGLITLVYGVAGVGCGHLAYSRPVAAWFRHSRGLALGATAIGLALTAALASPLVAHLVESEGWRAGFWALAAAAGLIALPAALLLIRDVPSGDSPGAKPEIASVTGVSLLRNRDFWFLEFSNLGMAIAGAGLLSQLSPLAQEEGVSATAAAYGVTAFAIGQVTGRIVAGWFLDHAEPRRVAFIFTFFPALGFLALALFQLPLAAVVVAIGLIGIQQGAEIDLFAYFVARRFGLTNYGIVYGWIVSAGWMGNALGILLFGWLFVTRGSYALAELIGAAMLALAAVLIALVRLETHPSASSHSFPARPPAP